MHYINANVTLGLYLTVIFRVNHLCREYSSCHMCRLFFNISQELYVHSPNKSKNIQKDFTDSFGNAWNVLFAILSHTHLQPIHFPQVKTTAITSTKWLIYLFRGWVSLFKNSIHFPFERQKVRTIEDCYKFAPEKKSFVSVSNCTQMFKCCFLWKPRRIKLELKKVENNTLWDSHVSFCWGIFHSMKNPNNSTCNFTI